MTESINPWGNMSRFSRRRVDTKSSHNIFWITDLEGKYGFCIKANELFKEVVIKSKLKGILILKRNSSNYGELFLILNDKEDWQIFHTLCEDLISITHKYENGEAMISAVEIRLQRWQELLKYDRRQKMTLERQMGLFSELSCLKDIIASHTDLKYAINSWVGAEFDKQDFLLDNAIVEVKSYRTSKGAVIKVSSLEQLYSEKEPLFLIVYSLTTSKNGLTISDLVYDIKKILEFRLNYICDIFDSKLLEYGFAPELMEIEPYAFIVDKVKAFYVSDDFPKIIPSNVKSQILSVKYQIDLYHCSKYEIEVDKIFNGSFK